MLFIKLTNLQDKLSINKVPIPKEYKYSNERIVAYTTPDKRDY